jgi:catechol 2,3-dioxygenase-like lactoylglutathione lyase family enzyme
MPLHTAGLAGPRAIIRTYPHGTDIMTDTSIAFDHVHVVSKEPHASARWYVDILGGTIDKSAEVHGAPQIYVALGAAMVIVRGERPAEKAADKTGLQWGVDHFGVLVKGDFDGFCAGLRGKGVKFTTDPTQANPTTRIAFIQAPDGVAIELVSRKD